MANQMTYLLQSTVLALDNGALGSLGDWSFGIHVDEVSKLQEWMICLDGRYILPSLIN